MTQHILISVNPTPPPKFIPTPAVASVWRDDQLVTWQLQGESLFWDPPSEDSPVFFLPADETHVAWVGSLPEPVGTLRLGERDKRVYVALGGKILAQGAPVETYHWAAWVNDGNGRARVQTLHVNLTDFVDPDLPNNPLP